MSILVTGGAGYIGAHVVRLLHERGEQVIVADDLSTGQLERIGEAKLLRIDISRDEAYRQLTDAMVDQDVDAVIHFAARKQVGESVERPSWYYRQNVGGLANLTRAMYDAGVDRMIFSSSAAVYGRPSVVPVDENMPTNPISPYGETKLIGEMLLADCETAWNLQWISLRYFNAAGTGWPDLADPATLNLIPIVLQNLFEGQTPKVFGNDYPTADGTCVRDYVHVVDLATAHLAALDNLLAGRPGNLGSDCLQTSGRSGSTGGWNAQNPASKPVGVGLAVVGETLLEDGVRGNIYNVGTGKGTSVQQILSGLQQSLGWEFPYEVTDRRKGDPVELVADCTRIQTDLGWQARLGVEEILESTVSAWQTGKKHIKIPN